MKTKPATVSALDDLGRVRLSSSFYMREFLYSEVANLHGIANIPDDPELAGEAAADDAHLASGLGVVHRPLALAAQAGIAAPWPGFG